MEVLSWKGLQDAFLSEIGKCSTVHVIHCVWIRISIYLNLHKYWNNTQESKTKLLLGSARRWG